MLNSMLFSKNVICVILVQASLVLLYHYSLVPTPIYQNMANRAKPLFEPDGVNCVVNRLETPSEVRNYLEMQPDRTCTLSYFHEYFKTNGQFYGKGAWDTQKVEYLPADCTFSNYTANKSSLSQCLDNKNISKILMTGDSTARLMTDSLLGLFSDLMRCKEVRNNAITPDGNITDDKKYFLTPEIPDDMFYSYSDSGVTSGERPGVARTFRCVSQTERTVYVEYISTTRLLHDIDILIKKHSLKGTGSRFDASHKLEYLLKYYFTYHGFPDLWLFKLPFRHELWWSTEEKIHIDIAYTIKLIGLYLPSWSTLLFLADSRECTKMLPHYINETWKANTVLELRNERLHLFNQIFYEVFHTLSNHFPNMYAFLDDMRLSCAMVCDFNKDGGHYTDAYYRSLSRYIFESICPVP